MSSPALHELQSLFWQSISRAREEGAFAPDLLAVTRPSAELDPAARLRVYADAYFWRLREALAEDFPRVASLLGSARFDDLVREYLRRHPSKRPSLRHLGCALPAFIASRDDVPLYLADLARLEWARLGVFDAADGASLAVERLRSVRPEDWPALRFAPIPAVELLRAEWPVHEIWERADANIAWTPAVTFLRIWRAEDCRVYHAAMDARDALALERLLSGEAFATVCESFDELSPAAGAHRATELLARWLDDGILAHVLDRAES